VGLGRARARGGCDLSRTRLVTIYHAINATGLLSFVCYLSYLFDVGCGTSYSSNFNRDLCVPLIMTASVKFLSNENDAPIDLISFDIMFENVRNSRALKLTRTRTDRE